MVLKVFMTIRRKSIKCNTDWYYFLLVYTLINPHVNSGIISLFLIPFQIMFNTTVDVYCVLTFCVHCQYLYLLVYSH